MDFLEIGEQPLDVIECMRTLGMPGKLHPLPGFRVHGFLLGRFRLGLFVTVGEDWFRFHA